MTLPCSAGAEWNIWIKTKAFMKWVLVLAKGKVNEHRGKKHPPDLLLEKKRDSTVNGTQV